MASGMAKKAARKRSALRGTLVYSVTMEVKVVIRADSREAAVLSALETHRISERLQSAKVTDVFCPAEGR